MIKNVIAKPHFLDLVDIEDVHDVDFEEEEENDDDDAVPLTMMIICQFRSQSAARPMGSPGHTATERRHFLEDREQSDQTGRIFAHWANIYFGTFLENYIIRLNIWATFAHGKC
jgi:hypothetical protein